MPKPLSAVAARKRLGALLDDIARNDAEYVIERWGKPAAAIIPIHSYEKLIKGGGDGFERIEALRHRLAQNATEQELEAAIDEAIEAERQRRT